jgi:tetratricopeptide (TPR) repeat protein
MSTPDNLEVLNKAEVLLAEGKCQEASALCDGILRVDPEDAAALTLKGHALTGLGRPVDALPFFKLARLHLPVYPPIRFNLAKAFDAVGQGKDALAEYDEALKLDGAYADARAQRAALREQLGDREGAIADLNGLVRRSPEEGRMWMLRGCFYTMIKRPDLGGPDLSKAVELDPGLIENIQNFFSSLPDKKESPPFDPQNWPI